MTNYELALLRLEALKLAVAHHPREWERYTEYYYDFLLKIKK